MNYCQMEPLLKQALREWERRAKEDKGSEGWHHSTYSWLHYRTLQPQWPCLSPHGTLPEHVQFSFTYKAKQRQSQKGLSGFTTPWYDLDSVCVQVTMLLAFLRLASLLFFIKHAFLSLAPSGTDTAAGLLSIQLKTSSFSAWRPSDASSAQTPPSPKTPLSNFTLPLPAQRPLWPPSADDMQVSPLPGMVLASGYIFSQGLDMPLQSLTNFSFWLGTSSGDVPPHTGWLILSSPLDWTDLREKLSTFFITIFRD